MSKPIRRSEKGGNTAYLNVGIWYEQDTEQIHMTVPGSGWFHTTVNDSPRSKRGHHSLFEMLTRALKEAGAPHPFTSADDAIADLMRERRKTL